jgi:ubiquitin-conjugating enzyme E2 J1
LVALRAFMETDAKGQLGGLECSVKERERMAESSSAWRCSTCGKSNAAIMKECEDAAKEKGEGAEVVVPSELRMGFKDEMGGAKDNEEGELAEGFVRTVDGAGDYPAARPAQGVPLPTGAATTARIQPAQRVQEQIAQRPNEGVPMWIDRSIAAVVVLLVAMVLKVLLGL